MISYTITSDENGDDAVKRAMLADQAFESLYDISQEIRRLYKYADLSEEEFNVIDKFREFFYEILTRNGIDLDLYYQ